MIGELKDQGRYEIFETERGRKILVMNQVNYYIWTKDGETYSLQATEGPMGKSGDKHWQLVNEGLYAVIELSDHTNYPGVAHLYLQHEGHYDEIVIQDGFPSGNALRRTIIVTGRTLPAEELETFIYQRQTR